MPAPIISNTTSILGYRKSQPFEYQLRADSAVTAWAASGLPSGMTLGESTGLISGAALSAGVYLVRVTATNGQGTSEPLDITVGIEDSYFNDGIGIDINVDLINGAVSIPGGFSGPTSLFAKRGDIVLLDIGFIKGQELQAFAVEQILFNLQEFDGETSAILSDGIVENVGSPDRPRYRIKVDFGSEELSNMLGNYEGDFRTTFNAIAEIEWHANWLPSGSNDPESFVRSSRTFRVEVDRDLIPN